MSSWTDFVKFDPGPQIDEAKKEILSEQTNQDLPRWIKTRII